MKEHLCRAANLQNSQHFYAARKRMASPLLRTLTLNQEFTFKGFGGCDSKCWLQVFEQPGQPVVVIATELDDNEGTSITNLAEGLATKVWQFLEKPEAGLIWIEHYPRRGDEDEIEQEESFDLVRFHDNGQVFTTPHWQRLSKEQVENMIGQPLEEAWRRKHR